MSDDRSFLPKLCVGSAFVVTIGGLTFYQLTKQKPIPTKSIDSTVPIDWEEFALEKCRHMVARADTLFKREKFCECIACHTNAISMCPPNRHGELANFYCKRAFVYRTSGDTTNAINDCTVAITLNPAHAAALRLRSAVADELNEYEIAVDDYAMQFFMQNLYDDKLSLAFRLSVGKLADKIYAKRGDTVLPLSSTYVERFLMSYACNPILHVYNENNSAGFERAGGDTKLFGYEKAMFCIRNKHYDKVVEACTQEIANERNRHILEALIIRGTFYTLLGFDAKAKDDFQKGLAHLNKLSMNDRNVLSVNAAKCNIFVNLALIERWNENFGEAERLLMVALEFDNKNADVHAHLARLKMCTETFEEATKCYEKAVDLKPNFVHFYIEKYSCDFERASDDIRETVVKGIVGEFERLMERFPNSAELRAALGRMCCEMEKYDLAIDFTKQALSLSPKNPTLLIQSGLLDIMTRNIEQGLESIRRAIEVDQYCWYAYNVLANFYLKMDDAVAANKHYEKALEVVTTKREMRELIFWKAKTKSVIYLN